MRSMLSPTPTIGLKRRYLDAAGLASVLGGATTLGKLSEAGGAKVEGAGVKFDELAGMLDTFKPDFNIVTP
ncbi:beta-lactamase [Cupriavidus basilensis OR16]|uniref:Beta-lactamase n=1 Tax=Cupriavidus basilensis OR16 TaxID=1127483 RepID=H1SA43_9BURK|nr:alkyl sulfatase C-terminal domain-containing protein [Cupriavidus basilensis]EHP40592.1 beta-lactamase [Cupriavidus basilensis OR16]